uniref:Phosphoglycerate mutase (2,3-diphosphoglycerate-dependent) n=1 Tax=Araucaria cunninghamii TaxID=56994 RepID=A0A0D6RBB5_ARACU
MGQVQSSQEQGRGEEIAEEEEETSAVELEEEEEQRLKQEEERKKVLEQEPEVLPCHPSASPLSPQLSFSGSPYMGPSVRVWDPYNILTSGAMSSPTLSSPTSAHSVSMDHHHSRWVPIEEELITEVYLIRHAESSANERPELIGGRSPSATLTANGKRQARALGVFLKTQGITFTSVYSSPLERAKQTGLAICQELKISEDKLEFSESLTEMSQGQWEGCPRSEIYTLDMLNIIERYQPDFCAPGGESQRQVEYRMVEFLNSRVLRRAENSIQRNSGQYNRQFKGSASQNSLMQVHPVEDGDDAGVTQWELFNRQKQLGRRRSGKSRLQFVTTGDNESANDSSREGGSWRQSQEQNKQPTECVGIFTHGMAIKCLLRGLLGSNPLMTHRLCIDNTSMTVLWHSFRTGWQIQRVNDTSHLRLL